MIRRSRPASESQREPARARQGIARVFRVLRKREVVIVNVIVVRCTTSDGVYVVRWRCSRVSADLVAWRRGRGGPRL